MPSKRTKQFSVIVVTFNSRRTVEKCLQSLLNQTTIHPEVIFVDNGSTDGTVELLQRYVGKIRLLMESKKGKSHALNLGLSHSTGEIVALTQPDCIVPSNWLENASNLFDKLVGSNLGAIGGGVIPVEVNGQSPRYSRLIHSFYYGVENDRRAMIVDSLMGMNMFVKKEVFSEVGMFRTDTGADGSGADAEFCLRLRTNKHNLIYDSSLNIVHDHFESFREVLKRWFSYGQWFLYPYLRHPAFVNLGVAARLLFFPAVVALLFCAVSLKSPVLLYALPAPPLLMFSSYFYRARNLRVNFGDRLYFSFLHTAKQLCQIGGIWLYLLKRPFLHGVATKSQSFQP